MTFKMADEGFKVVSRKKERKRGYSKKIAAGKASKDPGIDNTLEYCNIDRILSQIETYREEIRASSFYSHLKDILFPNKNEEAKDEIDDSSTQDSLKKEDKPIHSACHFDDIICYGLGCLRTCPNAKYQFALLLLLKAFLKISNEHCYIYEPLFNDHDKNIVKHFGCSIIDWNEEAKRTVTVYTLFFMPHCSKLLYNNVLWANWGVTLKNVVIFGNGFSSYQQRLPSRQLNSEVMYIAKILPYLQEVSIPNSFHLKDIFNDSSLHFFPEQILSKLEKDFWTPNPEPTYDINDPEIVTKEKLK